MLNYADPPTPVLLTLADPKQGRRSLEQQEWESPLKHKLGAQWGAFRQQWEKQGEVTHFYYL